MDEKDILKLPFIPLRGIVVFPDLLSHADLGRKKSLAALDAAMEGNRYIIVSSQLDPDLEEAGVDDVYEIGTLVKVDQLLRLPGGLVRVMLDGAARVRIQGFSEKEKYVEVAAVKVYDSHTDEKTEEALRRANVEKFVQWANNLRNSDELETRAREIQVPGTLADFIAMRLPISHVARQQILETANVTERLEEVRHLIDSEIEIAKLEMSLNREVREKMDKQQKEYYLREKIKVIHRELGDKIDRDTEVEELRAKVKKMKLPKKIEEPVLKEISRLEGMPSMMAETAIVRTYLDWVLALPWKKETRDRLESAGAGDVDDRPAAPLLHARQGDAGQFGQGHHVQLHLGGDALRWQVGEVADRPETRVVDQGVDLAGGQVGGQHGPGTAIGEVAGPGLHLDAMRGAQLGCERLQLVGAAGHQDQVRPLPREFPRKTGPEPTRGPRHNCPTCHGGSLGVQILDAPVAQRHCQSGGREYLSRSAIPYPKAG